MIHNIPTLINQYIAAAGAQDDVAAQHVADLSSLILDDTCSLLQFIQYLGPHLTSEDGLIRSKGVRCLTETLPPLSVKLSRQDVSVLVAFFLDKLNNSDDKFALHYILQGINHLILMKNFVGPSDKILTSLSSHYEPKQNLSKIRHETFQILFNLTTSQGSVIAADPELSNTFVKTFIHLASGEKDPRNLLSSFTLNIWISKNLDFSDSELHKTFLDDLFDVCFCYFPISFSPPANDPYKITSADLKSKLRETISCQSLYIKDSVPNLIEKLTSTNPIVRNDVLQTLLACVASYSSESINEYWLTIWNALKFEILHNDVSIFKPTNDTIIPNDYDTLLDDSDDNKSLVLTLDIISKLLSKLNDTEQDNFLTTSLAELKPNLLAMKDKCKQSVILISVILSDSVYSFQQVVRFLFAYDVWGKYLNVQPETQPEESLESDKGEDLVLNIAKKRDLVDSIGFVLTGYQVLYSKLSAQTSSPFLLQFLQNNELLLYKDHLLMFMGQLLMSSSNVEKTLKCKIVQQLVKLISIPEFLVDNEIKLILGYIDDLLSVFITTQPDWTNDLMVEQITEGLVVILGLNSHTQALVSEIILANLLNMLDAAQSANDLPQFTKLIDLIGKLCINSQILESLSIRLLNKLDTTLEFFQIIVDNLLKLVLQVQVESQFLMNSWSRSFVPQFVAHLVKLVGSGDRSYILLIESSGDLIGLIVRFIDVSKHQDMLEKFTTEFSSGTTDVLTSPSYLIGIYNKILANIDKSTSYPISDINPKLTSIIRGCPDEVLRVQYLTTLALINNKFITMDHAQLDILYDESSNVESFEILIWVIKALLLKLDPKGKELLNKLIDRLFSEATPYSEQLLISSSLRILFVDLSVFTPTIKGKLVSKVNNSNVKLLYKQQIFEMILPRLVENFESSPDRFDLYLNSLSVMIENVSSKILIQNLSSVLPLVLQGLKVRNSTLILTSSLSTLKVIITENREALDASKSEYIIRNLTQIATTKFKHNTEHVKVLSLECLIELFASKDLGQYKKATLSSLRPGLDDKKRSIRKLTGDLRQVLYEY